MALTVDDIQWLIELKEKQIEDVVREIEDFERTKEQEMTRRIAETERKSSDPNLAEEKEGQLKKMGDELRIDMSEEKGQLQKKKQQLYKQGDIYFSAKQSDKGKLCSILHCSYDC